MSADLGFTAILLSSLFRQLPSELAERNSTEVGHMLRNECYWKMYFRNLWYTLPLQIGAVKRCF